MSARISKQQQSEYVRKVQKLSLLNPALNRVLDFISYQSQEPYSRAAVIYHSGSTFGIQECGPGTSVAQLGRHVLRDASSAETPRTLVVEDIQPSGALVSLAA